MTAKKRKTAKPRVRRHVILREVRSWSLTTYLQWLPVASVTVGGIIWLTQLQDAVVALKSAAPATSLTAQLTHLEDLVAVNSNGIADIRAKELADYAEMKANDQDIWRHISNSKQDSKP